MSNPKPTLKTVIAKAVGLHTKGMRTSMPGRVESYSTATKMASVQPLLLEGDTSEQGDRTTTRLPVINNVPIIFPGSGGVRIKWPIKVGDYVWLNFCCRSIDRWLAQGGEVDPEDDRQHAIDDAVAFCIHNPASPNDATPMIEFTDTGILLGSGAVDAVIKGTSFRSAQATLDAALVTFFSLMNTNPAFLAAFGTVAAGAGTASAAVAAFETASTGFLSTIVKVQ